MKVIISKFSAADQCQWCNRNVEGVTAEYEKGFLARGHLCWKCLQRSTRVYAAQTGEVNPSVPPKAAREADKS